MPTSPRIIVSSPHEAEETDLIPPYGAAPAVLQQTSSDEEVPTPTWDSLAAVAESDLAPTRSTHTPRPTSIGDFGFTGTFISEETVLPGSLEIKKNKITLWASGAQLASWKPSDCKVQRMEGNQFSIEADDEMVTFTADDPEGLIDAISAHLTPEAVVGTVTEPAKAPKPAKTPKHTGPNKASETEAGDPIETDPVAIWFEPTNKPDRPIAAEPTVTAEPTDRHAPSSKPSPTARADHSPPIRRPRIKAFQTRSEGSTETAKSDSSRGSNEAGNAPSSDAAPAKVVEVPVLPAETEPATIADRITDTAKRRYKSARAHRWLKSDLETFAVKAGVIGAALGLLTLFAVTIFILAGGSGGETEGLSAHPRPPFPRPRRPLSWSPLCLPNLRLCSRPMPAN